MPNLFSSIIKRIIFIVMITASALLLCGFLFWGNDEKETKKEVIEPVKVEDFDMVLFAVHDGYSRYYNYVFIDTDRQIITDYSYIAGRRSYGHQNVSTYFYDIQDGNKLVRRKEPNDKSKDYILIKQTSTGVLYEEYLEGYKVYTYEESDLERVGARLSEYLKDNYHADDDMTPKSK